MLRVPVDQIQAGMVLARPIRSADRPHRPLLPRNAEVPVGAVAQLRRLGVREVWIRSRNLEFLDQAFDHELEERRRQLFARVRANFEAMLRHAEFEIDLDAYQSSILGLFEHLRERPMGVSLLESLHDFDDYLMSHSTNVGYLSLLAGIRLADYIRDERGTPPELESRDMFNLGLGALLHDVGKLQIAPEILHKPGPLRGEEFEAMKKHTVLGRDMLAGHADPEAVEVALHHHQRWDGNGYPDRFDARTEAAPRTLSGHEIPVFSRITSMADVYDAATSRRRYSPAKSAVQVLHEMRTSCQGAFDPVVARAFFEIVPPFPVGTTVGLSDGRTAVVVDLNPTAPVRPKVLGFDDRSAALQDGAASEEIDLTQAEGLEIVSVGGTCVKAFTASQGSLPEVGGE
jgi:HD-GYP domain-containing protein (c-di-GMP phosphodiesterase class II)